MTTRTNLHKHFFDISSFKDEITRIYIPVENLKIPLHLISVPISMEVLPIKEHHIAGPLDSMDCACAHTKSLVRRGADNKSKRVSVFEVL